MWFIVIGECGLHIFRNVVDLILHSYCSSRTRRTAPISGMNNSDIDGGSVRLCCVFLEDGWKTGVKTSGVVVLKR